MTIIALQIAVCIIFLIAGKLSVAIVDHTANLYGRLGYWVLIVAGSVAQGGIVHILNAAP